MSAGTWQQPSKVCWQTAVCPSAAPSLKPSPCFPSQDYIKPLQQALNRLLHVSVESQVCWGWGKLQNDKMSLMHQSILLQIVRFIDLPISKHRGAGPSAVAEYAVDQLALDTAAGLHVPDLGGRS